MNFFLTQKLKDEWCDALLSGNFKQASGALSYKDYHNGECGYCVLGVLGKIAKFKSFASYMLKNSDGDCEFLPQSTQEDLFRLNDEGKDFKFLAEYIKNNVQPNG